MHDEKMKNILNMSSEDRYVYSIKTIAEQEFLFLRIYKRFKKKLTVFTFKDFKFCSAWPDQEFADYMIANENTHHKKEHFIIKKIDLHDFIYSLESEKVEGEDLRINAFDFIEKKMENVEEQFNGYVRNNLFINFDKFVADINEELKKY